MLVSAYFDGGEGWLVVSKYLCTLLDTGKAKYSVLHKQRLADLGKKVCSDK